MTKENWNAPRPGQPAAIVIGKRGAYLARFPYEVAGGRENAHAAAHRWVGREAPRGAFVRGFTGEVRLVWEEADASA